MESTIRLCCCPLPKTPQLRLSNGYKGLANASSSRFHHTLFKFSHASLGASHFPTPHPIATRSLFLHANCFPDDKLFSSPSNNSEESNNNNNNVLRGVTGISLVLACALGLFNFNSKMNPMFSTAYAMSMSLPGGEAAVESLLKTITAPSNRTRPMYEREDLGPSKHDVDALKLYAASKNKYGSQRDAVKILKDEYEKYKDGSEERDNLRLALIELLIIQGNFEEARSKLLDPYINELIRQNKGVTDTKKSKIDNLLSIERENREKNMYLAAQIAQLILYKAIVQSMLKSYKKEAPKWWEAFAKLYFETKTASSEDQDLDLDLPN